MNTPVQEPVAWMAKMGSFTAIAETKKQLPKGSEATPLFTHPAKAKPLSENALIEIANSSWEGISPHADTLAFARAIERAHGIV